MDRRRKKDARAQWGKTSFVLETYCTFGGSTGWITGRRKALTACHKLDREDMLVYSKLGILYEEATYRAV
jgi:hypothetical protein